MDEMLTDDVEIPAPTVDETSSIQQFAERFVDMVSRTAKPRTFQGYGEEFSCCQCSELLCQPVTSPCGYSFCRTCSKETVQCYRCEMEHNQSSFTKLNVVLDGIIFRYYPDEYKAQISALEGDELLQQGSFEAAESKYTTALEIYPKYTYALYRRGLARKGMGSWEGALRDVITAKFRSKHVTNTQNQNEKEVSTELAAREESSIESCLQAIFKATANTGTIPSRPPIRSMQRMSFDDLEEEAVDSNEVMRDSSVESSSTITPNTEILEKMEAIINEKAADFTNLGNAEDDASTVVSTNGAKLENQDSEDFDDLDFCCILCTDTYYDPVCTPCGHTFCLGCLERCFDHGRSCPTCKTSLDGIYQFQKCSLPMNKSIDAIIRKHLPELTAEREEQRRIETSSLRETLPVFVCTVAFPTVRCYLHVFEPRYRLMLRRATRVHDGKFGITIESDTSPFHHVGTILDIENVSFFQDGRSLVTSMGTRRFEVVEFSSRDGYNTAKVKYIADEVEEGESAIRETARIGNEVYQRAKEWWTNRTTERFKSSVRQQHGDFPEMDNTTGDDGPSWPWWLVAVLPLNDKTRAYILAKTKLRERFGALHIILRRIQEG